jgi:hypothetical protein
MNCYCYQAEAVSREIQVLYGAECYLLVVDNGGKEVGGIYSSGQCVPVFFLVVGRTEEEEYAVVDEAMAERLRELVPRQE